MKYIIPSVCVCLIAIVLGFALRADSEKPITTTEFQDIPIMAAPEVTFIDSDISEPTIIITKEDILKMNREQLVNFAAALAVGDYMVQVLNHAERTEILRKLLPDYGR